MTNKLTKEEALKKVRGYLTDYLPLEDADEIDEIIEALEPSVTPSYNSIKTELKPCEECISREEAKKLIQGKIDDIPKNKDGTYDSMFGQYVNGLYCAKTAISYMSPVTPQPRTGHWMKVTNGRGGHECDLCHEYAPSYQSGDEYLTKYCPNCGARMDADMREVKENDR